MTEIRSNEPHIHKGIQSTKDLHIKDVDRQIYKRRLEKFGHHHIKQNEREAADQEFLRSNNRSNEVVEEQEQTTLVDKVENALSGALETTKDTLIGGFNVVKDAIFGSNEPKEDKSQES